MNRRGLLLLITGLLITTSFATVHTGAASGTLAVDAGSSRQVDGFSATLPVRGEVFGGQAPYAVSWTVGGAGDRFADADALDTTVDLEGLSGTVTLTLTVTDDAGNQASDTVLYHVPSGFQVLADEAFSVGPGVPDETIGASGAVDQSSREFAFTVPSGLDEIRAQLSWQDGAPGLVVASNDLDLVLLDPDGNQATNAQGQTANHPERVTVDAPQPGTWTARVEAWLSAPDDAELVIAGSSGGTIDLPLSWIRGPLMFGSLDAQVIHGDIYRAGGTSPQWDLDDDGVFETTGSDATASLAPGMHRVRLKATTPDGFEAIQAATVEVLPNVEHAFALWCNDRSGWEYTMEYTASGGTCWMHGGHNTYVFDDAFEILGGDGWAFSVEQQFSPPTEFENAPFETPIHLEASLDGQTWTEFEPGEYSFVENPIEGSAGLATRQKVHFSFDTDDPTPARFFRVHEPRSAAQGLSGFLDRTKLYLFANETDATPPTPGTEAGSLTLSCQDGDVMEDFFATHPCWFGGVNRYDAPSFFHTYTPGQGTMVTGVSGTVEVAPWRSDDWFTPITVIPQIDVDGPECSPGDRGGDEPWIDQTTGTCVFVQTSTDGVSWSTISAHPVLFGQPTAFNVSLDTPHPAPFVRLITDEHPTFDEYRQSAPLHHPEAYLLFSELTLEGDVPPSG